MEKEFRRNNLGTYDIALTNSGTTLSGENSSSVEYANLKIGQKERIKFGFNLKSVSRTQTFTTPQSEEEEPVAIPNGVYVKMVLTGEVFDVDDNGNRQKNVEYSNQLSNILSFHTYSTTDSWSKNKNTFYFEGSNNVDRKLVTEGQNYFFRGDIFIYFSKDYVDGSWFDKIVVLNFDFVAVDYLSSEANEWDSNIMGL